MANDMSTSLALRELRLRVEYESRNYWLVAASIEYASRYWEHFAPNKRPETLRQAPGDDRDPFKRLPLAPSAFVDAISEVAPSVREHAVVAFVTALETYLHNVIVGICIYQPSRFAGGKDESGSQIVFPVSEIAKHLNDAHFRRWFADQIAERIVRNKSPIGVYKRVCGLVKADHKDVKSDLEQWKFWSLVRNSIVHCGRTVSGELSHAFPSRYPSAGVTLNLGNSDITDISRLVLKLAQYLDRRYVDTVVEDRDACRLAEEIFIAEGVDDPGPIAARVYEVLKYPLERATAERIVRRLKKSVP